MTFDIQPFPLKAFRKLGVLCAWTKSTVRVLRLFQTGGYFLL